MPMAPVGLPKDRRPDVDVAELLNHAKRAKAELLHAASVPLPSSDADAMTLEEEAAAQAAAARQGSPQVDSGSGEGGPVAAEVDEEGESEVDAANAADVGEDGQPTNYAHLTQGGDDPENVPEDMAASPEGADAGAANVSDEVCGHWQSSKGGCRIYLDHMTNQLSYEEQLPDGCERLHGFLTKCEAAGSDGGVELYEAEIMVLDKDQRPWYGPSFGERPDVVGEIQVTFTHGSPPRLETRIKVTDEDTDWQAPTHFRKRPPPTVLAGNENVFVFGGGG